MNKFITIPITIYDHSKEDKQVNTDVDPRFYDPEYWLEDIGMEQPEEYKTDNKVDSVDEASITLRILRYRVDLISGYVATTKKYKGKLITNIYTEQDIYSTTLSPEELDKMIADVYKENKES